MDTKYIVSVKDETFAGKVLNEIVLNFQAEEITVKDLIEARVRQEVDAYNQKLSGHFRGLVEPTDAEKTLNGYKVKRHIDAEKQVYVALDAFLNNGYFVLIDQMQAESLEQRVHIAPDMAVSFVKLTPLVGG